MLSLSVLQFKRLSFKFEFETLIIEFQTLFFEI